MQYLLSVLSILASLTVGVVDERPFIVPDGDWYYVDETSPIDIDFERSDDDGKLYIKMTVENTTEDSLCFYTGYFPTSEFFNLEFYELNLLDNTWVEWISILAHPETPFQDFSIVSPGYSLQSATEFAKGADLPNADLTVTIYIHAAKCASLYGSHGSFDHYAITHILERVGGQIEKVPFSYPGVLYYGEATIKAEDHYVADE